MDHSPLLPPTHIDSLYLQVSPQLDVTMFTVFNFRHKLCFAAIVALVWSFTVPNESWALKVSTAPLATLYSDVNCSGQSLTTSTSLSDLTPKKFNDKSKSVMVTGVWTFFENGQYNDGKGTGLVEYVFQRHKECVNFGNIKRKISSLRLVGNETNFDDDYLTLYEGSFFQGAFQRIKKEVGNVKNLRKVTSLIINGRRDWTVYSMAGFKGTSVCVKPPKSTNFTPAFLQTIGNITNYKGSPIKSVRIGCRPEVKVHQVEAIQANTQVGFSIQGFKN